MFAHREVLGEDDDNFTCRIAFGFSIRSGSIDGRNLYGIKLLNADFYLVYQSGSGNEILDGCTSVGESLRSNIVTWGKADLFDYSVHE
ncbi:hypothetical protein EMIT0194MI4_20505 [Pseudomonas sp. IT-194MI4]